MAGPLLTFRLRCPFHDCTHCWMAWFMVGLPVRSNNQNARSVETTVLAHRYRPQWTPPFLVWWSASAVPVSRQAKRATAATSAVARRVCVRVML